MGMREVHLISIICKVDCNFVLITQFSDKLQISKQRSFVAEKYVNIISEPETQNTELQMLKQTENKHQVFHITSANQNCCFTVFFLSGGNILSGPSPTS